VDLRRSSATFGSWVGAVLDSQENAMLWIPPGFAHGFYVLSETADLAYKCTDYYAPEHDRTLAWDDPDIHIDWPLVGGHAPLLSARDAAGAPFKRAETFP
jgi:dTDP-4-dehydrorhamnose 3,5-epimerase